MNHKYRKLLLLDLCLVLVCVSCIEDTLPADGTDADFTHFEFAYINGDIIATVDRHNKTITATIDDIADLSNLCPVFVLSHQAKAFVNDVEQVSGVNTHDFSRPVEYKIVSGNNQVINTYQVIISADSGTIIPINDMVVNQTTVLTANEYDVKGNIIVEEGVYLSLLPGCRFRLSPNSKIIVKPNARFLAIGTRERPIRFFSTETNDNTKAWGGFEFNSPIEVEFDYCTFDNGGSNCPMMSLNNTQIGFQRCKINNIHNNGFVLDSNSMFRIFDDDTLKNVGEKDNYYPIYVDNINTIANLGANNEISTSKGIYIQNSKIKRSITLHSQTCPYIFANDISCAVDDITFFIREGVHIQMLNNKGIYLGNSKILFEAKGLQNERIIFSGVDEIDGFWDGIVFNENILDGSKMSFCDVVYGGNNKNQGAIRCSGTTTTKLSIQNCIISNTKSHCIYIEKGSSVILQNNMCSIADGYTDVFREE